MENPVESTESMLLDEVMEEDSLAAPDSGNANEIGSLDTLNSAISEAAVATADGELPEHLLETEREAPTDIVNDETLTEDIDGNNEESVMAQQLDNEAESLVEGDRDTEMAADGGEETSRSFEHPEVSSLEQVDEPMETHDEAISTTDDFLSETKALIVEGEPPHQLMEEADANEEENTGEDLVGTSGIEEPSDVPVTAADEAMFEYVQHKSEEPSQAEAEEGMLLEQQEESGVQEALDPLPEPQENELQPVPEKMEEPTSPSNNENATELSELAAEDSATDTGDTLELPLSEGEIDSSAAANASGFTILAAGDHMGGSLSDLNGKLVVNPDGTVHLLSGQETLQGMQLMEGDDKPEEEANGEETAAQMQERIRAQLHEALMKQEEIKQEQEEREPETSSDSQPGAESDALATLASAALHHQTPSNGVKNEVESSDVKNEGDEPQWMDVGICKGTHCIVRTFFVPNEEGQSWDKNWQGVTTSTLPDHRALAKLELEAGKAYKFRVAAINSSGRGPWSEISAFRTSMPGVPSAPSSIKISKTTEGAHLTWDPPSAASGQIADYTVYMAVRKATTDSQVVSSGATQLAFVRIYQGVENQCSVGFETLSEAHIDGGAKPAILFRIAARNEKGMGPAIQVRWLQDGAAAVNPANKAATAPRRVGPEIKPHTSIKRLKGECD
ncbi:host cell factor 1-like isoform X2 [Thrips palmi]|nr:host cell factor 1-like isoform X2 [Thrips palmi]XP_034250589.1 host cell factor 1-like isoform X2 [Thrips palmi]